MIPERLKGWFASSSRFVASSARLAKKQAELATLNNVTLPRLYHAIGKRMIDSKNLPADLVSHRERIQQMEAAIAAKPKERRHEPAGGFTAKVRHIAQRAVAKTKKVTADTATSISIQSAYVTFGKQAIEKYSSDVLPQDWRDQYEAAMRKRSSLVDEIGGGHLAAARSMLSPRTLVIGGGTICVLIGLWLVRSATGWLFDDSTAPTIGVVVAADEQRSRGRISRGDEPSDEPENPQGESPLQSLVRVPRGEDRDPGWTIQALHRTFRETDSRIERGTDADRLLSAYRSCSGIWQSTSGLTDSLDRYGLPRTFWRTQSAIPAWQGRRSGLAPFVQVTKQGNGTRATLAPIQITDDLLCSISFLVIDKSLSERAAGLDFLATQIELYGGEQADLGTSSFIRSDTLIDFWSSTKKERYTVSRWQSNDGIGHITVKTYAPLLFAVLNSDPDFMFIENLKITLPQRFRKGCRELCDKVMELRKAQGQENPPACQPP